MTRVGYVPPEIYAAALAQDRDAEELHVILERRGRGDGTGHLSVFPVIWPEEPREYREPWQPLILPFTPTESCLPLPPNARERVAEKQLRLRRERESSEIIKNLQASRALGWEEK